MAQPCLVVSGTWGRWAQSKAGANLIYKYPILLDACANEMQLKGDSMMSKCGPPAAHRAHVPTFPVPYDTRGTSCTTL